MIDRAELLKIVKGQRQGAWARVVRGGLSLLTPVYRAVVGWRNRRFDQDTGQRIQRAEIPVISIGNLTTGGTGKTPLVIYVARLLRARGLRVVIISRGYQRSGGEQLGRNDEALEMEVRLPDVPHLQDPDRYRMTQIAVEELESQVAVLDDGFQHRQLQRDLDIVLLDATEPFGYDRLLPRGLLREPVRSLARADAIIVTRCELVSAEAVIDIQRRVQAVAPQTPCFTAATKITGLTQHDGTATFVSQLADERLLAFCGIGNPDGFLGTLQQQALKVAAHREFEDHHDFTRADLESLAAAAREANATALICTHKDLVKIAVNQFQEFPIYALQIEVEIIDGEQNLQQLIEQCVWKAVLYPQSYEG